jgi:hypothetical protein
MARENQGVQIALIAAVILTLIFGGLSFYFYKQYTEANIKEQAATKNEGEAKRKGDELAKLVALLKKEAGFKETDQEADCTKAFQDDVTTYGAGAPDLDYRKLVKTLQATISSRNLEVDNLKALNEKVNADLKAREGIAQPKIDKAVGEADAHKKELLDKTQEYTARRDEADKNRDELKDKLDSAEKEVDKIKEIGRTKIGEANDRLSLLLKKSHKLQEDYAKVIKQHFDTASGKITWVDQRTKMVWLNLGKADFLGPLTSFSVYSSDATDVSRAEKKATIEVTQVLGDHFSEARIVDDKATNPIMTGDLIHTPIWSPGMQKHFAFVGVMDLNNSGKSDLETLITLIKSGGGVVDAYLDDKGTPFGKITERTNYVIKGKEPTIAAKKLGDVADAKKEQHMFDSFNSMLGDADRLAVKVVPLSDFLEQIGYRDHNRVIKYGVGAPPGQFEPVAPETGNPVSNGTVSPLFQPRKPPLPLPLGGTY